MQLSKLTIDRFSDQLHLYVRPSYDPKKTGFQNPQSVAEHNQVGKGFAFRVNLPQMAGFILSDSLPTYFVASWQSG